MAVLSTQIKVLRKLLLQSWAPALLALIYAGWEFSSLPAQQRSPAGFIRSWGVTFFLIMWFVGQWFRTSKQIVDSEQLTAIQQGIDKSLQLLQDRVEQAATEAPNQPVAIHPDVIAGSTPPNEGAIARILSEVPKSAKGALLMLGAELERQLRQLLWSSGWIQGVGKATITKSIDHLVKLGVLSKTWGGSVQAFLEVRNRLLHGYGVTEDEVLRGVDIGLTVLQAVLAIPCEQNRVFHAGVDVYEDPDCQRLRQGITAIVLETTSPGGAAKTMRVFPTTRTNLSKGQRVTWEWNMSAVYGPSWYRHPDTGNIKEGWTSSAEFVGRDIEQI